MTTASQTTTHDAASQMIRDVDVEVGCTDAASRDTEVASNGVAGRLIGGGTVVASCATGTGHTCLADVVGGGGHSWEQVSTS